MDSFSVFEEKQKFKQIWIWLLLVALNGQFIFAVIYQVIMGYSYGNNPMNDSSLVVSGIISMVISLLFLSLRLDTVINDEGVSVRFYPFQRKYRTYSWDAISRAYIREYRPIREYGGWGIRMGAYNVSGKIGLQLELKDGSKFLIGTNKAEEIERILKALSRS